MCENVVLHCSICVKVSKNDIRKEVTFNVIEEVNMHIQQIYLNNTSNVYILCIRWVWQV